MAVFNGTHKEFRRYIGPRLRNLVQQLTKKHKAIISACEHCGANEQLESAHVHGRDRNEIIEKLLKEYISDSQISVNIEKFEELFAKEHEPLEKSILILCRVCHRKYDAKNKSDSQKQPKSAISSLNTNNNQLVMPIIFEPLDPDKFKHKLLLSKRALIVTYFSDGRVLEKVWNADRFKISSNLLGNLRSRPEYRAGNWQRAGITRIHLKILDCC